MEWLRQCIRRMDSGGDIRRMDAARVWTGNREAP